MNVQIAQRNIYGTIIRREVHVLQDEVSIMQKGFRTMFVEHDSALGEIRIKVGDEIVYSQMERKEQDDADDR